MARPRASAASAERSDVLLGHRIRLMFSPCPEVAATTRPSRARADGASRPANPSAVKLTGTQPVHRHNERVPHAPPTRPEPDEPGIATAAGPLVHVGEAVITAMELPTIQFGAGTAGQVSCPLWPGSP